ncbi:MAG: LysM peptidoglycan-binding domain-containing protein [Gammaproteobacteria bacterium]|nr:LysM peptidoglycan-binding domain-containing protein [Gammaproteobacteria bacterium]
MNTADSLFQHSKTTKLLTLLILLCFVAGCTNSGSPRHTAPPSPETKKTLFSGGATITPITKRLHGSSSFNGGVLSLDYSNTGNLWDKLPSQFQMPDESDNPAVQTQIRWFLKHPDYLERTSRRAAPYIYYIYEQVQARQLPVELILLPINESAYNPFSTSVAGAGGIWQMTRGTASQYHVKQNWWYDGRRDVYTSTKAALDHLTYLQNFFNGDWLLVLAAYNCGEGTVQRAIRRNAAQGKSTDFWSLSLPEETRAYVPRFLALVTILRDRQAYHIDLPPIEDQPYLTQVDVDNPISLGEAAHLAGMRLPELKQLNPGHKYTGKTPRDPFKLVLPLDRVDTFKNNLASYSSHGRAIDFSNREEDEPEQQQNRAISVAAPISPNIPSGQPITRIVKRGDNLSTIAKLYKVSPREIVQWNQLHSNHLKPGTRLVVGYLNTDTTPRSEGTSRKKMNVAKNSPKRSHYYVVRSGDTVSKIALHHNISPSALQTWNHLAQGGRSLKPGQKLVVRQG